MEPITLKPWNSLYDGYMSIAKELFSMRNSTFVLNKLSHKYLDYYTSLIRTFNELMSTSELKDDITSNDVQCIKDITYELQLIINDITFHTFLVAYTNIISFISFLKGDKMLMSISEYKCLLITRDKYTPINLIDSYAYPIDMNRFH